MSRQAGESSDLVGSPRGLDVQSRDGILDVVQSHPEQMQAHRENLSEGGCRGELLGVICVGLPHIGKTILPQFLVSDAVETEYLDIVASFENVGDVHFV